MGQGFGKDVKPHKQYRCGWETMVKRQRQVKHKDIVL